jgi:hypothetical protein
MKFIKKLQQKPRSTRLLILWLASFSIMVVVIIIWLFSQSLSIEETKRKTEVGDFPSLLESLGKDFSIFKQGLEAELENVNLEINNLEENGEGEQQEE